jgi:hypothetical protein
MVTYHFRSYILYKYTYSDLHVFQLKHGVIRHDADIDWNNYKWTNNVYLCNFNTA